MRFLPSRIVVLALVSAVIVLSRALPAMAEAEVNVSTGNTETGKPLAARGFDVVTYFTDGKPTPGTTDFTTVHGDATYRFASQEHLDLFKASPEKYLPRYGGYCAYGASHGGKFDGDPTVWKIVDDKLYFNLSPKVQSLWNQDIPAMIKQADENWKSIEHKAPGEMK
jgi:YHS domain-containing protein